MSIRRSVSRLLTLGLMALGASASAGTATVYYYTPYKGWSAPYIHHNASGSWTSPPGLALSAACTGWMMGTLTTGTASTFQAVFTEQFAEGAVL